MKKTMITTLIYLSLNFFIRRNNMSVFIRVNFNWKNSFIIIFKYINSCCSYYIFNIYHLNDLQSLNIILLILLMIFFLFFYFLHSFFSLFHCLIFYFLFLYIFPLNLILKFFCFLIKLLLLLLLIERVTILIKKLLDFWLNFI